MDGGSPDPMYLGHNLNRVLPECGYDDEVDEVDDDDVSYEDAIARVPVCERVGLPMKDIGCLSMSTYDPTYFQNAIKEFIEDELGDKVRLIQDSDVFHDFKDEKTIPLPQGVLAGHPIHVRWQALEESDGYVAASNGIRIGTIRPHKDRIGPAYAASVDWGDNHSTVQFMSEGCADKALQDYHKSCESSLPYDVNAFPAAAIEWSESIARFFGGGIRDKLEKHKVAQQMGVILSGPPGTGKTMYVRYLERLLEMSKNHYTPTSLVMATKRGAPLPDEGIIVLDDVEELLVERSDGNSTNILPWLLSHADAKDTSIKRLLVLVTNHPEKLDDALLRPGRFDTSIKFEPPTKEQMLAALKFHMADDYEESIARYVCGKLLDKSRTLAHVSYLSRLVYSGFVRDWDQALETLKSSDYRGLKHNKLSRGIGFAPTEPE